MLKIDKVETHLTEAKAKFTYADVVETLGMRVGLEAGLSSSAPGTTVNLEWDEADAEGNSGVLVHLVKDHNFVPSPDLGPGDGAGDASIKSDGLAADAAPQTPPAPQSGAAVPPIGGLQIPGAQTA